MSLVLLRGQLRSGAADLRGMVMSRWHLLVLGAAQMLPRLVVAEHQEATLARAGLFWSVQTRRVAISLWGKGRAFQQVKIERYMTKPLSFLHSLAIVISA